MSDRNSGFGLVEVLDRVLDKGIVVDAAVRVSVVGVELLGVDARVVVASIETYLRHADALAYTSMAAAFPQTRSPEPPLFAEPLPQGAEEPTVAGALPAEGDTARPGDEVSEPGPEREGDTTDPPPATGL